MYGFLLKNKSLILFLLLSSFISCRESNASIICTNLAATESNTDATSYNTASLSPTAYSLVILTVQSFVATGPPVEPTISGNGLTWISVNTNTTNYSSNRRITQFVAMGNAPSSGVITIDFGAETQSHAVWVVDQCSGVFYSKTASDAVVQVGDSTGTGFATSQTITLSAFSGNSNVAYGVLSHGTNEATTPGTGFAELSDNVVSDAGTLAGVQSQWSTNDATVDWSWSTSSRMQGVAMEIKPETTTLQGSVMDGGTYE